MSYEELSRATEEEQARELSRYRDPRILKTEAAAIVTVPDDPRVIAANTLLADVNDLNTNIANIQKSIESHERELENLVGYQRVLTTRRDALEQIAHELSGS